MALLPLQRKCTTDFYHQQKSTTRSRARTGTIKINNLGLSVWQTVAAHG
jgi:hypothetical protein